MIKAAIRMGGGSIGFSEHSYVSFDEEYSMSIANTPLYISEINNLREKYTGVIDVFIGLEMDYFTGRAPDGLEYIIGAVHHVEKDGVYITVDGCANHLKHMNTKYYNSDFYALAESYYKTIADIIPKTGASIVGHFDLVSKHNINGCMMDEMNPRYIKAALDAMDQILQSCKIFEVNTGAMYRLNKPGPYPSEYLLKELYKRGGEVLLSSDSHTAESLYYKFDEMLEFIKACGFGYIKRLTNDGFIDVKI